MCILFIAIDRHSSHPLIVAANRDEFHARPSEAMHHWPDFPAILAGRDRQAGGTWLGFNRRGRFAAVTNIRTPGLNDATAQSRGELVARFLRDQDSVADFSAYLADRHNRFNPFNLVYGSADELYRFSSLEARVCQWKFH